MKLGVIGRGRAASALVPRWLAAGHTIDQRRDDVGGIDADVIVLAVPDGAIEEVARALDGVGQIWLHLSGAKPSSILRVNDQPRAVGCLHPLVALVDAESALDGAVAGIEGEPEAVAVATQLARDVGLVPQPIDPAKKAIYHAAAVTVAGHATALFAQAMGMMAAAGMDPETARRALGPLFRSAAHNLERGDPASVSTGPIVRGDAATIAAHLDALDRWDPNDAATYRLLATTALGLVGERLSAAERAAISAVLSAAPGPARA